MEGFYILKVMDRVGNIKIVLFVIDMIFSEVKGFEYGKIYMKFVVFIFFEGIVILDGKFFISGMLIFMYGNYILFVIDKVGNVIRVNFIFNMKFILSGVLFDNFLFNMLFNLWVNVFVKDSSGKDLIKNIVIKGEVNIKVVVWYILMYSVSD